MIGVAEYGGDLTLQEIATGVADPSDELGRQQAMNAGVLAQLVASSHILPGELNIWNRAR